MGGRGVFDPTGLAQPTEAKQLQILADAGISAQDVDLVVQDRLRPRHETAREDLAGLRAGLNAMARHADVGAPVPLADRRRKGARVTETDEIGAWRMLAAAIAHAEAAAADDNTPEQVAEMRRITLGGMVRREAEGKHDDNLRLIDGARPPKVYRRGGG